MKVILRLKNWKIDNTKRAWDTVIGHVPPYYRSGVSHEKLSEAFCNGGSFYIDFGESTTVAKDFMMGLVANSANTFDIGTGD